MSVKFHEAYALDSQQDQLLWWDDFLGDQVQDEWRTGGSGSVNVIDQQTGGIARLATLATGGSAATLDWNTIRSLLVTKRVSMELRAKLSSVASINVSLWLRFDINNYVRFRYTIGLDANWSIMTANGGAGTSVASGIIPDVSYHIYRIEVHTHGGNHAHFYIDGTETANSPIITNLPVTGGSEHLQPYFYLSTQVDTEKQLDIDYVVVRQDI